MSESPQPVTELDWELRQQIRRFHRVRWFLVAIGGVVLILALIIGGMVLAQQQAELRSGCGFFSELANVPLKPAPPLRRPSALSVELVKHSRQAYRGLGCHPAAPPNRSLIYWEHYYHIPTRGN